MLQRRKRYKNRTILGFKTLAIGTINMSQVGGGNERRKKENTFRLLDLRALGSSCDFYFHFGLHHGHTSIELDLAVCLRNPPKDAKKRPADSSSFLDSIAGSHPGCLPTTPTTNPPFPTLHSFFSLSPIRTVRASYTSFPSLSSFSATTSNLRGGERRGKRLDSGKSD